MLRSIRDLALPKGIWERVRHYPALPKSIWKRVRHYPDLPKGIWERVKHYPALPKGIWESWALLSTTENINFLLGLYYKHSLGFKFTKLFRVSQ